VRVSSRESSISGDDYQKMKNEASIETLELNHPDEMKQTQQHITYQLPAKQALKKESKKKIP
jgi:uncharacterized lipoprotein